MAGRFIRADLRSTFATGSDRLAFSIHLLIIIIMIVSLTPLHAGATSKQEHVLGLLVGVSGLGDQSFNDMTYAGLIRIRQEYDLKLVYEDSEKAEDAFDASMVRLLEKGATIVVANGFYFAELVKKYAGLYPNRYFILQDAELPDLPNVISVRYSVAEGSFLAGAFAGMMSSTGKLGFIGGVDIPIMHEFRKGFSAGIGFVNSGAQVVEQFISKAPDFSGFRDPAQGFELARAMYGNGTDIIYVAAGLSGNGVMQAAKMAEKYAIGVDSDQDHLAVGYVLTSMMKRLDIATYMEASRIINGNFSPGVVHYGLRENGVGLSGMKFTRHLVPPEVMKKLAEIEDDIIAGKIDVLGRGTTSAKQSVVED